MSHEITTQEELDELLSTDTQQGDVEVAQFDEFHDLVTAMRLRANQRLLENNGAAFLVKVERNEVYEAYLANLPDDKRQEYTCNCCKNFLREYGNAVIVAQEDCKVRSLFWDEGLAPDLFQPAVKAMRELVESRTIANVFVSKADMVGVEHKGGYDHFAVDVTALRTGFYDHKSDKQNKAWARETQRMFSEAGGLFQGDLLERALQIFDADERLAGYPQFVAFLTLFQSYHRKLAQLGEAKDRVAKANLTWLCSVMLPVGVTRIKGTVLGEFLDGLRNNESLDDLIGKFRGMTKPTTYQRPQAAPAEQNIAKAEALIVQLGLESALHRRHARADELEYVWAPKSPEGSDEPKSVFGAVKARDAKPEAATLELKGGKITVDDLVDTLLPTAEQIEWILPKGLHATFGTFVTAVHADALPILRYDHLDNRQPVNYYVFNKPTPVPVWGLPDTKQTVRVLGVCELPETWGGRISQHARMVAFVLEGAHPTQQVGQALFPQDLIREVHEIKDVIEAYSNATPLPGMDEGCAALFFNLDHQAEINLEVIITKGDVRTTYTVDRTK